MTLTPEQATSLADHRRNVAWNESMLAAAVAKKDAPSVAKYTAQVAAEKGAVAALETLEAQPAAVPAPGLGLTVDAVAQILVRLGKVEADLSAQKAAQARAQGALDALLVAVSSDLAILSAEATREAQGSAAAIDATAKVAAAIQALKGPPP